jgi:small subunit ribosomal protein S16
MGIGGGIYRVLPVKIAWDIQVLRLIYENPYAIVCSMLNIRLQRVGRKNDPSYRLVVINSRYAAKSGKAIEILGSVDFRKKVILAEGVKADKIKDYIAKGAQPSDTVHNLFIDAGILTGKKINVLSRKSPIKKEAAAA